MRLLRPIASMFRAVFLVPVFALLVAAAPKDEYAPVVKPIPSAAIVWGGNGQRGTGSLVSRADRLLVTDAVVAEDRGKPYVTFPAYQDTKVLVNVSHYARKAARVPVKVLGRDASRNLGLLELDSVPADAAELVLAAEAARPKDRVHIGAYGAGGPQAWFSETGWVEVVGLTRSDAGAGRKGFRVKGEGKLRPGACGAPAVNDRGELLGIVNQIAQGSDKVDCVDVAEVRTFVADALRGQATAAIRGGQYPQAVAWCDKALRFNPKDAQTYQERGVAHSYQDRFDEAIADYTAALKQDPVLARAYRSRGSAYFYKGKHEQAVADCTEAIKIDPNYASAYQTRAKAYAALKKTAEAQADNARATQLLTQERR